MESREWQEPFQAHMSPSESKEVAKEVLKSIVSEDEAEIHPTKDIRAEVQSKRTIATEMTTTLLHQYPLSALEVSSMWLQLVLSKYEAVLFFFTTDWDMAVKRSLWNTTLQGSSAHSGRLPYPPPAVVSQCLSHLLALVPGNDGSTSSCPSMLKVSNILRHAWFGNQPMTTCWQPRTASSYAIGGQGDLGPTFYP